MNILWICIPSNQCSITCRILTGQWSLYA